MYNLPLVETSAKDGSKVDDCFLILTKQMLGGVEDVEPRRERLDLSKKPGGEEKPPSKKRCIV